MGIQYPIHMPQEAPAVKRRWAAIGCVPSHVVRPERKSLRLRGDLAGDPPWLTGGAAAGGGEKGGNAERAGPTGGGARGGPPPPRRRSRERPPCDAIVVRPTPGETRGRGGIYVHIPFCVEKCAYCDFYSGG